MQNHLALIGNQLEYCVFFIVSYSFYLSISLFSREDRLCVAITNNFGDIFISISRE